MFFYALIGVALGARVNEMAAPVYHPAQAEWRQQRLGRAVSSWGSGDNCAYDAAYHKCCTKNETQYDEWTNNDSFNCPFYGVEEEQATTTKKSGPPKKKSNTLWIVLLRLVFMSIGTVACFYDPSPGKQQNASGEEMQAVQQSQPQYQAPQQRYVAPPETDQSNQPAQESSA